GGGGAGEGGGRGGRLGAGGAQQHPPMFRALVGLLSDENEELRAVAFLALAPIREYILGGSNGGQFPPPGGWQKWLEKITAEQEGDLVYYRVCGPAGTHTGTQPADRFCAGGELTNKKPALAFQ